MWRHPEAQRHNAARRLTTARSAHSLNVVGVAQPRSEVALTIGEPSIRQLRAYQEDVGRLVAEAIDAGNVSLSCLKVRIALKGRPIWSQAVDELFDVHRAWTGRVERVARRIEEAGEQSPPDELDGLRSDLESAKARAAAAQDAALAADDERQVARFVDDTARRVNEALRWVAECCHHQAKVTLNELENQLILLMDRIGGSEDDGPTSGRLTAAENVRGATVRPTEASRAGGPTYQAVPGEATTRSDVQF